MSRAIGLLRCRVGDEAYGFEMSSVASVRHASTMLRPRTSSPGEPVGWVSSPAEPDVPVYRLSDCLNRPVVAADSRQHVVVIHTSLGSQGFQVDSVSRVLSVPAEQVHPVPELLNDPARRLFKSVALFRQPGRADSMSLVLSPERLHRHAVPLTSAHSGEHCGDRRPLENHGRVGQAALRRAGPPSFDSNSDGGQALEASWSHPTTETHSERIVLFPLTNSRINGHELLCGLSVTQVAEILEPLPIIPVPFAPPHVAGFVLWREQPVPVVDISQCLRVSARLETTRMMIARQGGDLVALLTPHSLKARRLPLPHQPCMTPSDLDATAILGTFQTESELLIVPNLSRLARPQSLGI